MNETYKFHHVKIRISTLVCLTYLVWGTYCRFGPLSGPWMLVRDNQVERVFGYTLLAGFAVALLVAATTNRQPLAILLLVIVPVAWWGIGVFLGVAYSV